MKKKFIVAVAASMVLANGATVAFADRGSDSDKSERSITSEHSREHGREHGRKHFNFKMTDAQKAAFEAARSAFKDKHEAIMATFHTAMENAKDAFETARELATTDEARKAAEAAHKAAVITATQIKTEALKALGPKPEKPALTAEQIAAIAKYRQDLITFEVARAAYKDKREIIRETYKTAKENAKEAFKTARELATTDEARDAAKAAFKTAVDVARQAYEVARIALGESPEKPEKPDFFK